MLTIPPESHVDHIPASVLEFVKTTFADRDSFFIETITLPPELPTINCGLHGPVMGDDPIPDSDVDWDARPGRNYLSRLVDRPVRPTRTLTVIAGPFLGQPCVLYTAFGGPLAPKEYGDPTLKPEEMDASLKFWTQHALSRPNPKGESK